MATRAFEIVPARPQDATLICEIRAHNWREQFGGLPGVDPDWIDGEVARITSDDHVELRAAAIAGSLRPDAPNYWRVARLAVGRTIVGFVEGRILDDGGQKLHSIHVAEAYRGEGVGQILMDDVHGWFDPLQPVHLDVVHDNRRAQAFYRRPANNYRPTDYTYAYGQLTILRMQRDAQA